MDWLKDKKNQPIVIGVFAVVIVAAVVFVLFSQGIIGGSSEDSSASSDSSSASQPAPTTTSSTDTSAPAANNTAQPAAGSATTPAAGAQVAGIMPIESWRQDPFEPIGYKKPKKAVKVSEPILDLPIQHFEHPTKIPPVVLEYTESVQPIRRMAGLLLNGRVYAIIETNGTTEMVQPGDMLNDRLAKVDRIERDKVILKTTDRKPRYITVRMTGAAHQANSTGGENPSSSGGSNRPVRPGYSTPGG